MSDYDEAVLKRAAQYATKSPDPSTQNGAILVASLGRLQISYGWNDFPPLVGKHDYRWERPIKYNFVEHAERNAIFRAVRCGENPYGSTLYALWAACADCARAIVLCGIETLVRAKIPVDGSYERWAESCKVGDRIMIESGVTIKEVDMAGLIDFDIRRDGEPWRP